MRAWPLLLLLAACARRDRPYVPAASPLDPTLPRVEVAPDGKLKVPVGSKHVLLDVPGRLRIRDLWKEFLEAFHAGVKEMGALVDTPAGEGVVPLRFPVATAGLGYQDGEKISMLWRFGESLDTPGARVRPGMDGAYEVLETGAIGDFELVFEDPVYSAGAPAPKPRKRGTPPALEEARFIVLCASSEDLFQDVVLSLVALEKRFPGKVVLEVLTK